MSDLPTGDDSSDDRCTDLNCDGGEGCPDRGPVPVTPTDLDEIERLANEATPGPWYAAEPGQCCKGPCIVNLHSEGVHDTDDISYRDQKFIAAARSAVPAMAAELRQLRDEVLRLLAQRDVARKRERQLWEQRQAVLDLCDVAAKNPQ